METTLNKAQIGCSRVFGVKDQYHDEHYRAREMTVPVVDHQSGVPIRVYGVVPKMSLTPGRIWRGAASIGEDTTDILSKMLGLSEPQIAALYNDHVVHRTEPFTDRTGRSRPSLSTLGRDGRHPALGARALRYPAAGPVARIFGDLDQGIPVEAVEALRAAAATSGQPTKVIRYPDAGHGFHCDQRVVPRAVGQGCLGGHAGLGPSLPDCLTARAASWCEQRPRAGAQVLWSSSAEL